MGFLSGIPIIGDIVDFASKNFFANKANNAQWELQQAQIDAQKELQTSQNTWNEQMWEKNNAYNTPLNQANLYRDAGLNPGFFLGQGNSVSPTQASSSAISAPSVPQPADNYSAAGSALGKMGFDFLNAELINSEVARNYAAAGKDDSETDFNRLTMESRAKYQDLLNDLTEESKKKVIEEQNSLHTHQDYERSMIDLNGVELEQQKIILNTLPLFKEKELRLLETTITEKLSSADLNRAQVRYNKAMLGLIREQIETEKMRQYDIFTHARTNETQADLNDANKKFVESETTNQDISNEIRNENKDIEAFSNKTELLLSPILDGIDRVSSSYRNFRVGRSLRGQRSSTITPYDWNRGRRP